MPRDFVHASISAIALSAIAISACSTPTQPTKPAEPAPAKPARQADECGSPNPTKFPSLGRELVTLEDIYTKHEWKLEGEPHWSTKGHVALLLRQPPPYQDTVAVAFAERTEGGFVFLGGIKPPEISFVGEGAEPLPPGVPIPVWDLRVRPCGATFAVEAERFRMGDTTDCPEGSEHCGELRDQFWMTPTLANEECRRGTWTADPPRCDG